ncbi:MMPL family transporter [Paenibacillus sp. CGMCC 1.16610]|uniref:MMPL family transporter n=1 Tax=Paenibacillus anseongense TaxID=2682845 RepID=A0ABW9UCU4_9BACL|nr:MMPL family transporter [Paenibacillus sp. CGMCC 1.16610]MVQ37977.1 MMPL family transporter [Paenibacillus anseongense]
MCVRESAVKGKFWRWGYAMHRYRWLVLTLCVLLFLSFALFAQKTPGILKDNGFTPKGSESDLGLIQLRDELGVPLTTINLVYTGDGLDMTKQEQQMAIMDSLSELKKLPYVENVNFVAAPRNEGHLNVQAVNVSLDLDTDPALEKYPELKERVQPPAGMKVYVTGGPAILHDMQEASKHDIAKSEAIGLPIALIVLLIVFGTLVAALLPMIVGLMSVTLTLGITYFIAQHQSLSNFLPNMVTMLGLAVGIDYALFLVSRFREELKVQPNVAEAVAMTCQTAGKSIFFSGIAVLIGLLGMLFVDLTFFRSLCLGGIIVVSISVVVANTMLLALLAVLGKRINSLQVLPKRFRKQESSQFWEKMAYGVMKRPVLLVILVGGALIYAMTPIGQMKLSVPNAEVLPPNYESRYGSDLLKTTYDPRMTGPIQIVVHTGDDIWAESAIRQVRTYGDKVKGVSGVKEVQSYLTSLGQHTDAELAGMLKAPGVKEQIEGAKLAKGHTALLVVVPENDPDDPSTDGLVRKLRSLEREGLDVAVTGGPAYRLDIIDRIQDEIPYVLTFVMGITYFVLLIAFRSILLPLKAVLMNMLSLGASLGCVVLVFQHGYLADLLHITSIGYVSATLPVIIFCVVFGISMDYEVFLISRIMEEYEASGDNDKSTAEGLKKTGSLITSAAFILVVVVGSFIFTDIEIMKALGLGLGLAVLIDATIVRVMLVPALMKLLGNANWWAPKWLRVKSPIPAEKP